VSDRRYQYYLFAARSARGLGDGFAAIILPAYLAEIGFSPLQIGVVATAALLGSAVLTLAIGLPGSRYDLRAEGEICRSVLPARLVSYGAMA